MENFSQMDCLGVLSEINRIVDLLSMNQHFAIVRPHCDFNLSLQISVPAVCDGDEEFTSAGTAFTTEHKKFLENQKMVLVKIVTKSVQNHNNKMIKYLAEGDFDRNDVANWPGETILAVATHMMRASGKKLKKK